MPEKLNPPLSEAPENDSWLWDWGIYTVPYPGQSKDFEVATIECWKYKEDEQGRTVPPIKRFQVRGFHTESMQSWLKEPVPVVNGQQPSSGFKMVVMPSNPDLTREQTQSLNTILGLPNSRDHMSSDYSGACGMFEQSDGSHVFVLRSTTDTATMSTAVRYDPTTNVARGVFNFTNMHHGFPIYETMADQFVHCSHPLLLPLLAIETTFSIVALHLATYATNLYDVEVQTGHGLGRMDGEVQERQDYRTLVRGLGVAQSQYYLAQGTISWCRISAEFIRDKLQHFQSVLPEERRSRLQLAHRMLNERVEFVLSNLECASVFHGLKERMEAQQTVLFNLIAQSDNLINVGLAKDSKEMAVASKQDSSAMKIIALLTTFFLPGTFIASFFAMPLFDWSEPTLSRVANRHFWVYWAVTGPLTVTIMAGVMAWAVWHNRYVERLQSRARDSVGTNSTDDKGRNKEHHESENGQGKGQYTEQRQGMETEKQGFRQMYSLRKALNRRKRQFATVEAEP